MLMLRSFLVSASLEGLEPGWRPPPRPVPVVWFDRIRRVRAARLHQLAADLAARAAFPAMDTVEPAPSSTGVTGDGWRVVLCTDAPAPATRTVA